MKVSPFIGCHECGLNLTNYTIHEKIYYNDAGGMGYGFDCLCSAFFRQVGPWTRGNDCCEWSR